MSFKLLKITSCYKDFLTQYYRKHPAIVLTDYKSQFLHFVQQDYGWSNYYTQHFSAYGVEVMEVYHNMKPMQEAWAKEHGLRGDQNIVMQQIKFFKPDVVFFQDVASFSPAFFKQVREEISTVRLLFGHYCAPLNEDTLQKISCMDFALACSEGYKLHFEARNIKSYLFRHAFEAGIAERIKAENNFPEESLLFIGSFFRTTNSDGHDERLRIMEEIVRREIPARIYGNLDVTTIARIIPRQLLYLLVQGLNKTGMQWLMGHNTTFQKFSKLNEFPRRSRYSQRFLERVIQEPLFGIEMYKATSKARVSLNVHGAVAGDYAANMRMFEITGVGSLLLTDHKKNIQSVFEPDKEIVTFTSGTDCVEKLEWLLDHPEEAKAIAAAGQKRTIKDHTFQKRVEMLHEIILREIRKV